MDEIKERKLQAVREDLDMLKLRLNEIEEDVMEEKVNWQEKLDDFIMEHQEGGTITLAVDVSSSMIPYRHLAYLLTKNAIELNNQDMSLICFGAEIELYIKYLREPEIGSVVFGGNGDLLELFEYLERNEIENPLVVFSDGILYPTMLPEVSRLGMTLREYDYPMLYIFPSKGLYKRNINNMSRALDCVNIAFMTR